MDIEVQILNKVITLKEPSFNDYKSLVKNLQTTDNFINALNSFLENFTEVKWQGNNILLFGSEGYGIKQHTKKYTDFSDRIDID